MRARNLSEFDEKYVPSVEQIARIQAFGRAVRSHKDVDGSAPQPSFRALKPSSSQARSRGCDTLSTAAFLPHLHPGVAAKEVQG